MGRRTLLLIASLLVAAVGTALIWMYVQGAEERARGGQAAVTVWVTTQAVAANTPIDQVLAASRPEQVARSLAGGALTDTGQAKGQVSSVPLPAGVVLTPGMFTTPGQAPLPIKIAPDKVAISVQVGDPQRVAGFLRPDSSIVIFQTADESAGTGKGASGGTALTRVVLDKVKVLTTGSTATQSVSRANANGQTTTQNLPQSIVTLELTPKEAALLVEAQATGALYFALYSGDNSTAKAPSGQLTAADLG